MSATCQACAAKAPNAFLCARLSQRFRGPLSMTDTRHTPNIAPQANQTAKRHQCDYLKEPA